MSTFHFPRTKNICVIAPVCGCIKSGSANVFNTDIEIQFYSCFYESVWKILEYAVDKGVEYISVF